MSEQSVNSGGCQGMILTVALSAIFIVAIISTIFVVAIWPIQDLQRRVGQLETQIQK